MIQIPKALFVFNLLNLFLTTSGLMQKNEHFCAVAIKRMQYHCSSATVIVEHHL